MLAYVVGRPLDAAVPAEIGVVAVLVVLAVGLVVLLVVRHEIPQREAVVAGEEIDGVPRLPAGRAVQVGTAAQPRRQVGDRAGVAAPEAAHVVAVTAVPLRPAAAEREVADLVKSAGVPRLGDQLGVAEDALLGDHLDDGRLHQHVALVVASHDGGQVEAQAVRVHVGHPEAQAVHQQLADDGVVAIDGVAAPGKVQITAVRPDHVVEEVVQAAEGVGAAAVVPLAGVVEDDVEIHLDAGRVEGPHRLAELDELAVLRARAGVGRLGRPEGDAVVAPQVAVLLAVGRVDEGTIRLVELVNRQQLDGRHAERLEIRNLLGEAGEGARVGGQRGGVAAEAADVQLVDDGVFERRQEGGVLLPVEGPAEVDAAARRAVLFRLGTGWLRWRRLVRAVAAGSKDRWCWGRSGGRGCGGRPRWPAVGEGRRQASREDVPVVAGAVAAGVEGDLGDRLAALEARADHEEGTRRSVAAEGGEVDAVRLGRAPNGRHRPRAIRRVSIEVSGCRR